MAASTKPRLRGQELRNDLAARVAKLPAAKPADFTHPKAEKPAFTDVNIHKVIDPKNAEQKELLATLLRNGGAKVLQAPSGGPQAATSVAQGTKYVVEFVPAFDFKPEVKTRAPRTGTGGGRRSDGGVVSIPRAALPFDHAKVRQYLEAVAPNAQRAFEQRKQEGLTDVEVSRAIKGLKGGMLVAKMRELEATTNQTFREHLTTLGFTSEMIDVLGIPEVGPDHTDK